MLPPPRPAVVDIDTPCLGDIISSCSTSLKVDVYCCCTHTTKEKNIYISIHLGYHVTVTNSAVYGWKYIQRVTSTEHLKDLTIRISGWVCITILTSSTIIYTETSTKHGKIICKEENFKSLEQTRKETNADVERRCMMLIRYVSQSLNLPMQTTLSTSSAVADGPEHTVLINQRMQRRAHGQI